MLKQQLTFTLGDGSMKPATPLPWNVPAKYPRYVEGGSLQGVCKTYSASIGGGDAQDASYIAHAANAYPRLVGALKQMREEYARLPHSLGYTFTHLPKIDALLRELGEE